MGLEQQVTLSDGAVAAVTVQHGERPTVVLVHGWRCRRRDFAAMMRALPSFDLRAIDLPGHGDSPPIASGQTVAGLGAVLADFIKTLAGPPVVLVGHSMGAAVCLEAAGRLGEQVRQVVALDALTYAGIYPRQTEAVVDAALQGLRADFGEGMAALVEGLFPDRSQPELMETVAREMADADPAPALDLLADLLRWDMAAAVARVGCPVSVLAATALLTPEGRAGIPPQVAVHEFPLGGHFYLREYPREAAEALSALLPHEDPGAS
jgi:pimeloyl-ACP methyl ester carboxylesterase